MRSLYITLILCMVAVTYSYSQGCVAVRQMGGLNAMCSSASYNLYKKEFQVGVNYRYFHSWRHFVGSEEQPHRQTTGGGHDANGKERGNAVNIYSHALDFNVSYGLSDRLQVNLTLPFVHNERSQVLRQTKPMKDTTRYSVYAKGLADVRMSVNYWLIDPAKTQKGNIMVGAGLKLPTGNYRAIGDAPQADGTVKEVVMDQAIQPGDGGLGFSVEVQAFRVIHRNLYAFANGYYLFNPRESNGAFKSDPKPGLEGYEIYASPDQYFVRAGVMTAVGKEKNLILSLAGRVEGIPAYDVFGGQVAYRRPGYVESIEPGITYRRGQHTINLFVPYNFYKNRIQSAADKASERLQNASITDESKKVTVHGDAAFADYSINLGYAFRF